MEVILKVNGKEVKALKGEMLASALWKAGYKVFRKSPKGHPRSIFCGMGTCFECIVTVNGKRIRSCITPVEEGMEVEIEES